MKKYLFQVIILLQFLSAILIAQTGTISGSIIDLDLDDPLLGANVVIVGTTFGAATDIIGNYKIEQVPVGTYKLKFSMIGFETAYVENVVVKPNKNVIVNQGLSLKAIETEEVVIKTSLLEDSEGSMLVQRQRSSSISDAISAEQFSRSGASSATDITKQIVGASVAEGKYVLVRGLGDRYTSTQLNGASIPSVDPYRRSGSIDIVPANLIDNVKAVKSFTPDKKGDFSGGTVDIKTKNFPEKSTFNINAKVSSNSAISFSQNGLTYKGSATDWLGYDDGMRDIPDIIGNNRWQANSGAAQTNEAEAQKIDDVTKAFNTQMTPITDFVPMNSEFGISFGDNIYDKKLGYIGSFTYKNKNFGYTDGQLNRWARGVADINKTQLDTTFALADSKRMQEILWAAIMKVSYKFDENNAISINGIYNQNGESTARNLTGSYPYDIDPEWDFNASALLYKQRSLSSIQLSGENRFNFFKDLLVYYQGSLSNSTQDEPDNRYFYSYKTPSGASGIKTNTAPERFYRYTKEDDKEFQVDFTLPFRQWNDKESQLKFGGYLSGKHRDFNERRFAYQPSTKLGKYYRDAGGDAEKLFSNSDYLGWLRQDTLSNGMTLNRLGLYIQETDQTSSNYIGDNNISALYAMVELPITSTIKFIGGTRFEKTDMKTESQKGIEFNAQIKTNDLLPSVAIIYNGLKNMNFRLSYGKTLARPSFREISPFQNYDFNGGDTYVGNPDLERTLIDNYDFRWEWFMRPGEVFAVSAFYKRFSNPIETKIQNAVNNVLTWTNVPSANILGIEIEARGELSFISTTLSKFTFGGNLSLINSSVDIAEEELQNIKIYEPNFGTTRPFQGQSPYLINSYLNYDNYKSGWSASIYYNVFGRRLYAVGSVGAPDVYEEPIHQLNFTVTKSLISNLRIKIAVKNLLNQKSKKTQEFKGTKYIYSQHPLGTQFEVGFTFNI